MCINVKVDIFKIRIWGKKEQIFGKQSKKVFYLLDEEETVTCEPISVVKMNVYSDLSVIYLLTVCGLCVFSVLFHCSPTWTNVGDMCGTPEDCVNLNLLSSFWWWPKMNRSKTVSKSLRHQFLKLKSAVFLLKWKHFKLQWKQKKVSLKEFLFFPSQLETERQSFCLFVCLFMFESLQM